MNKFEGFKRDGYPQLQADNITRDLSLGLRTTTNPPTSTTATENTQSDNLDVIYNQLNSAIKTLKELQEKEYYEQVSAPIPNVSFFGQENVSADNTDIFDGVKYLQDSIVKSNDRLKENQPPRLSAPLNQDSSAKYATKNKVNSGKLAMYNRLIRDLFAHDVPIPDGFSGSITPANERRQQSRPGVGTKNPSPNNDWRPKRIGFLTPDRDVSWRQPLEAVSYTHLTLPTKA